MILLLDENLPPKVAAALHASGTVEAYHVTKYLPRGASDPEIFEFLREREGWFLVTQDKNIRKRPQELAALKAARVGAFVLTSKADRTVESLLVLLVRSLEQMRRLTARTPRPFIFGLSDRIRFERLV